MAKHYSKRASKNRAYKKGRTIRKLRNTIRRKLHMVGGGLAEDQMIKLMLELAPKVIPIILSLINLGNVELLMSIIKLLSGSGLRIGGGLNKRQKQRGGGGLKDQVLIKLDELKLKFAGNEPVLNCIDTIRAKISSVPPIETTQATYSTSELESLKKDLENQTPLSTDSFSIEAAPVAPVAPVAQQTVASPQIEAAKLKIHEKIVAFFNERIKNTITAKIDTKIDNLREKVGVDVIDCLKILKTAIVNDLAEQLRQRKDQIKDYVIETLNSVGSAFFGRLIFAAEQLAFGNTAAVTDMAKKDAKDTFDAVSNKASEVRSALNSRVATFLPSWSKNNLSTRPKT